MLAAVNTRDGESIMEDINNVIFSVLDKPKARNAWEILEQQYNDGASEQWLYDEMNRLIKEEDEVN